MNFFFSTNIWVNKADPRIDDEKFTNLKKLNLLKAVEFKANFVKASLICAIFKNAF